MGLLGMLVGLGLLMYLSYRGWSVLLLAPAAALVVAALSAAASAQVPHHPQQASARASGSAWAQELRASAWGSATASASVTSARAAPLAKMWSREPDRPEKL